MTVIRNVTVVIPHFQKQDALVKTFEELRLQLHVDDEVIIVDDYSPDGIPDLNCPCVKVIYPPELPIHIYRLNTLRNLGVEHASNDAVVIIDPDCIPNPHFLSHARKIYDPATLYAGWITYLKEDGSCLKPDPRSRSGGGSRWTDRINRSCGMVWGGCMYFSKRRAGITGLFDTEFDGHWGAEEHVFASACRNSGMRLRYEKGLMVNHQWHIKQRAGSPSRNNKLFREKIAKHRASLNLFTPYDPIVAVLMVSMMRPYYIEQNMRAIFRHSVPLKVRLVNNGDHSASQRKTMEWWSDRWAVEYVNYQKQRLLSDIRSEAMRDYHEKKYKYLIMMDDDITPVYGSITKLIAEAEKHPEYHAISGYIVDSNERQRFIGGKIREGQHYYHHPVSPITLEADYTSSGFTIIRLDEVIPYTEGWEMGWADWDWSNEVKAKGLKVAVTGKAKAYHRYLFTSKGRKWMGDPPKYRAIRRNSARHDRMASKFMDKWGYWPYADKPITRMPPWLA